MKKKKKFKAMVDKYKALGREQKRLERLSTSLFSKIDKINTRMEILYDQADALFEEIHDKD